MSDQSWVEGDSRYLGTEANLGHALDTAEVLNGVHTRRRANGGYQAAMRERLSF